MQLCWTIHTAACRFVAVVDMDVDTEEDSACYGGRESGLGRIWTYSFSPAFVQIDMQCLVDHHASSLGQRNTSQEETRGNLSSRRLIFAFHPLSSTLYILPQEQAAYANCARVDRGNKTTLGLERDVGKVKLPHRCRRTNARMSLKVAADF